MQRKKKFQLPKNLKPFDIVEIVWADHATHAGWANVENALNSEVYVAKTVGYFLGEGRDGQIVTAATAGMANDTNGQSYRLKSDIRSIRKLK